MIEHLRSGALWNIGVHLKLLFSLNCQTIIAFMAILSLHFHHLWVCHILHYIVSPQMCIRHTVRNVGPPHLGFPFPVGLPPSYRSLQWITLFPFTCGSNTLWEMWVRHIWGFPFWWVRHLSHPVTIAFRATRILSTVGVYILVNRSLQSYQNPDNSKSSHSCSYQSYQKSGKHNPSPIKYRHYQLSEVTT